MGIGTSKKTGQQAEEGEAKKDNQEPCIRGGSFCMHTMGILVSITYTRLKT